MFHVFEALDELVAMIEEARGLPMSAQCLVPRADALLLLDEIREALPGELDEAQDVLDKRDSLIDEANTYSDTTRSDTDAAVEQQIETARSDADRMIADAKDKADRMLAEATNTSTVMVTNARNEADRLIHDGQRDYEAVTERAHAEAERLISKANDDYDDCVAAGIAERTRLVSESEVVRTSRDEATRIVDSAHAEADRLRGECDVYVDTKLAEFESVLSATSREVLNGRKKLRSTIGVGSRTVDDDYADYEPTGAVYDTNLQDGFDEDYNGYPPESYQD